MGFSYKELLPILETYLDIYDLMALISLCLLLGTIPISIIYRLLYFKVLQISFCAFIILQANSYIN